MRKNNPIMVIGISMLIWALLSGCGVLDARLAAGTAVASGKGVTGAEDEMSPEEIATALAGTLSAIYSQTPAATTAGEQPSETEMPATATPTATQENEYTPTTAGAQFTALAQTLTSMAGTPEPGDAVTTEEAGGGEALPTDAPIPEPVAENPCNSFRFVAHVTYPIDTVVEPLTYFYKSWEVQNTGACTWNSNYALVYYDGFQLGGQTPLAFGGTVVVSPGQYVTLSVQLFTPPQPGVYYSYWMLRDDQGHLFGGGENGTEPLVVEVVVPGDLEPPYTNPVTTAPPFTPAP